MVENLSWKLTEYLGWLCLKTSSAARANPHDSRLDHWEGFLHFGFCETKDQTWHYLVSLGAWPCQPSSVPSVSLTIIGNNNTHLVRLEFEINELSGAHTELAVFRRSEWPETGNFIWLNLVQRVTARKLVDVTRSCIKVKSLQVFRLGLPCLLSSLKAVMSRNRALHAVIVKQVPSDSGKPSAYLSATLAPQNLWRLWRCRARLTLSQPVAAQLAGMWLLRPFLPVIFHWRSIIFSLRIFLCINCPAHW